MFYLSKIPKVCHYFWEGNLSYLRYVSMLSFLKLNPDWKVKIHTSKGGIVTPTWKTSEHSKLQITNNYFNLLKCIANTEVIEHDFTKFGMLNTMHPVHKSDAIRWHLLSSEGGLWSDNDIIYLKPIDNLMENIPKNSASDTILCKYKSCNVHAIGFMMSGKGNNFFKTIFDSSKRMFNSRHYQAIGTNLLQKIDEQTVSRFGATALYIDEKCVYKIWANDCDKLAGNTYSLDYFSDTIGCHWYGGSPTINDVENRITEENYLQDSSVIARLIEKVLKENQ